MSGYVALMPIVVTETVHPESVNCAAVASLLVKVTVAKSTLFGIEKQVPSYL
eukprot:CAMPEP_0180426106 /NCGR_PEP_ID=MMETSP1036_2-20121128/5622_1 /TAXON_ID=632150 /ORGANISM="Azadinium spinosum, Strain 3D9" /LENGTH=51 /DNA_ID=CAMNT_0022431645 /DNA_START=336 /DNA_END=491 /DNA_ORIENTATION=+